MDKPSTYYRTWFHWLIMEGEDWPTRWALVPLYSYIFVFLFLDPIFFLHVKLIPPSKHEGIHFEDEPLVPTALWTYRIYDWIRVNLVEKFSIKFIDGYAVWPPPQATRNSLNE